MNTALLICVENRETLSRQFVDTLSRQRVAQQIETTTFSGLETALRNLTEVNHIAIFPCVVTLPDALREDLHRRLQALQKERPAVHLHLTPPLGSDPRLIDMVKDRIAVALKGLHDAPILIVQGPEGVRKLGFDDLSALPGQIPDVRTIVPDRQGQGVWVRNVLPDLPDAQVVFHADDDRFSASVSLALVREKGFLIYGMDGQPLPASYGGPMRLLIPGHDDRCANVKGVARIEIRSAK